MNSPLQLGRSLLKAPALPIAALAASVVLGASPPAQAQVSSLNWQDGITQDLWAIFDPVAQTSFSLTFSSPVLVTVADGVFVSDGGFAPAPPNGVTAVSPSSPTFNFTSSSCTAASTNCSGQVVIAGGSQLLWDFNAGGKNTIIGLDTGTPFDFEWTAPTATTLGFINVDFAGTAANVFGNVGPLTASDIRIAGGAFTFQDTSATSPASYSVQVDVTPQTVPGPLPLFGAAMAFGYSRKLRGRLKSVST